VNITAFVDVTCRFQLARAQPESGTTAKKRKILALPVGTLHSFYAKISFSLLLCLILVAPRKLKSTSTSTKAVMSRLPTCTKRVPNGSTFRARQSRFRPEANHLASGHPPRPSPTDFPRIDAGTQKRRDDIRRQVLQDEINGERKNAAEARRQLALGERLAPGERRDRCRVI